MTIDLVVGTNGTLAQIVPIYAEGQKLQCVDTVNT